MIERTALEVPLQSHKLAQFVNDEASKATSTPQARDAINQVPPRPIQSRSIRANSLFDPRVAARDAVSIVVRSIETTPMETGFAVVWK